MAEDTSGVRRSARALPDPASAGWYDVSLDYSEECVGV
jgi:hypothetical protein